MNDAKSDRFIEEDEVDLLQLLGVIFKFKRFIILFTLLAALGILAFSILSLLLPPAMSPLPNIYRPEALILVQDEQQDGLSAALSSSEVGVLAGLAGISSGSGYGELAVKLLESKSIIDRIVSEYELIKRYRVRRHPITHSRNKVKKRSSFEFDEDTNTISVSFEDYDPALATEVTNRMVELLDQRFLSIGGNKNLTKKNLMENKLLDVSAEMSRLEALIQDFQERHGALSVEVLAKEQITMMAELRSRLILKEMEIKTYSDFSKIEDPILKRLRSERENLLGLIREVEEGFSSYEKVMPPQRDLPELALEFAHMERDLFIQGKIYEILTQQYELAKLDIEAAEPIFQILELAEVPDKKSGPSRSIICIVTVFAAFFLSIFAAFILNAIRRIRDDPDKLKKLRGNG